MRIINMKKLSAKKRYIFLIICAGLLFFGVNMCDTERYDGIDIDKDLKELNEDKDSVLNVVDDIIKSHNEDKEKRLNEKDSLLNILSNNKNLSQKEIDNLKNLISKKNEEIIEIDSLIENSVVTVKDTIIYNPIQVDTIIYIQDTIFRETIVVTDTVYKVDTIIYTQDQIKKIKLNKD